MDGRLREQVQVRASQRCEYCGLPERAVPYIVFHIDHIIAKQHLDEVDESIETLAWACSHCNYHKGPNIASLDPDTGQLTPLFNPRSDNWDEHFVIDESRIVGRTPIGRATARLLGMNKPRLVRLRRELIALGEL